MSEWIDVKNELPVRGVRVWVWPNEIPAYYFETFDAHGMHYDTGWYSDESVRPLEGVTHWMPLPKPPNDEGKRHE